MRAYKADPFVHFEISGKTREMLKRLIERVLLATVLACLLWPRAHAHACFFRPGCLQDLLPVAGETLPANFAVIGIQRCIGASDITFSAERDGMSRPIAFDQQEAVGVASVESEKHFTKTLGFHALITRTPLMPGDTLVLRYTAQADQDAGMHEVEARWPIGEDERLPANLGKLQVRQDNSVIHIAADSSCSRWMTSNHADVSLEYTDQLKPWLPRLRYELRVDDNPWIYFDSIGGQHETGSWRSSLGRGKDRVILGCEVDPHRPVINDQHLAPKALEPGRHRVRMLGFLPTGEELSSEEIVIDMQCGPDTARALKAQLDACTGPKTESQAHALEADGGEATACSVVAPGSARGKSLFTVLLLALCFMRLRRRVD